MESLYSCQACECAPSPVPSLLLVQQRSQMSFSLCVICMVLPALPRPAGRGSPGGSAAVSQQRSVNTRLAASNAEDTQGQNE